MGEAVVHKRSALGKRKKGQKKYGDKSEKRGKSIPGTGKKVDKRMKRLFRKRAREYNSDDEGEEEDAAPEVSEREQVKEKNFKGTKHQNNMEEDHQKFEENQVSDDSGRDDEEMQPGVTRFTGGCKAFRIAFANVIKRNVADNELGPVLSAHKRLVVEKLAEEEAERKVKKETKKEKHLIEEKGHVKLDKFLDSHEKFLIGVATKGVVKLFNAVNKAQVAQRGLNPTRSKDAKVLRQRRKQVFFSELRKSSGQSTDAASQPGSANGDQPAWAPLRDSFMLTTQKLKDWDKKPETKVADDMGSMSDASSDDE